MTRHCVAVLLALVFCGATTMPVRADDQSPAENSTSVDPNDDPTPLPDGEAEVQGQNSSDGEIMKKFTRHRPGGCPEGPPCNFED